MGIPVNTILSLAGAFIKNDTGNPVKRATVGAVKAPVTAPIAVGKAVKEKPLETTAIATIGTVLGSFLAREDIDVYQFSLDALDKFFDFGITIAKLFA